MTEVSDWIAEIDAVAPLVVFEDSAAMTAATVAAIKRACMEAIAQRGQASLVLSGGRTPEGVYAALRAEGFGRTGPIFATLSDERFVAEYAAQSNAAMLKRAWLDGAPGVEFLSLQQDLSSPEACAAAFAEKLKAFPQPFDLTLLGMGGDAHTASLFPHNAALDAAFSGEVDVVAAPVGENGAMPDLPRISLTPRILLQSRSILLLITGKDKLQALASALKHGDERAAPILSLVTAGKAALQIFWAP